VQIQPERAPGIDMDALTAAFQALVSRIDLVRHHAFDHGQDRGAYYNYTFGTERPAELWRTIRATIFEAPEHREHLARSAMAMCSGEDGWDRYSQLCHWDPAVPVVSAADL
jgi:hypothetical protein